MHKRIRILLPALGFAALSCSVAEEIAYGRVDPEGAAAEVYNYPATVADPDHCNLTEWLEVSQEIVRDETNEFGTRDCWYDLTVKNLQMLEPVKVVAWFHEVDTTQEVGDGHLDKHEWDVLATLYPDQSQTWSGYCTKSSDDDGITITVTAVDRIAAISDTEVCRRYIEDEDFLSGVAVDITPVCEYFL
jgi:hypothetical protein